MCGVAAIYSYHYASPGVNPVELRKISGAMKARGPDGSDEWFSENRRVALAHRRLSIIDLSDKASQPMLSREGTLAISFNGEIYNYKELRRSLEEKGYCFASQSDTEVLLNLYAQKGELMVHDLRGMFAFTIWDAHKRSLLLARDPYGIKPLYYSDDGWTIRVASQVKALLAGRGVSPDPDPAGIAGYFLTGSVPESLTLYRNISALPAGSLMWVSSLGAADPVRYYSISKIYSEASQRTPSLSTKEMTGRVQQALAESVRCHFVADVPVGLFLSSGIDSGSLVSLAKSIGVGKVRTINLSFSSYRRQKEDETPLAQEIANAFGTDHHTHIFNLDEIPSQLPAFFRAMDQPTIDGLNTYLICQVASQKGFKVALSGLGGDELFGGYPSFRMIPFSRRWLRIPGHIPGGGALVRNLIHPLCRYGIPPKLSGLVRYGGTYEGAYFLKRGLFLPWELRALVGDELAHEGLRTFNPTARIQSEIDSDLKTPFARIASMESSFYLRNQLLRDSDWAGMAHSVEIRVPYVDAFLLKTMAPLLVSSQPTTSKDLLWKSLSRPLPDAVIQQPKKGFSIPMNDLINNNDSLDGWKRIPLLKLKHCHWSRRWAYTVYHRFMKT